MGRVARFDVRNRGIRVWVILGAVALALTLAIPAFGTWGSSPSKECSSSTWNGKYWKAEISSSFSIKSVESNVSESLISLSINKYKKATWSLEASSDHAVFRIYEKGGKYTQVNGGFWLPGESDTFTVEKSISHITFCFADIPDPKVSISKTTNGADPTASDPNYIGFEQTVNWTYVVKNTGSVALKDIVVTDDKEGVIGTHSGPLDPGKTLTFEKSADGGAEESDYPIGYTNLATVTAKSKIDGSEVEASDTSGYFGANPSIAIEILNSPGTVAVGSPVIWRIGVTNSGNVPLSDVTVSLSGVTLGTCVLDPDGSSSDLTPCVIGTIGPQSSVILEYTEIAVAGANERAFEVVGNFSPLAVSDSATSQTGSYEGDNPPVALPDTYDADERTLEIGEPVAQTSSFPAPGVLDNDTDVEDDNADPPVPLTADAATIITAEGGSVELASTGAFTYTPALLSDEDWDALGAFSYEDTWEYTVVDSAGLTDSTTVTMSVNRVVCLGEEVADESASGLVVGAFTLLETEDDPCKAYEVDALENDAGEADDDLITLLVPGNGNLATFRGELTFTPRPLTEGGAWILDVVYDPDDDGPMPSRTLQICEPPFEYVEGLVEEAVLPAGETWCNAGWNSTPSATVPGLVDTVIQVYGVGDPGFSAR